MTEISILNNVLEDVNLFESDFVSDRFAVESRWGLPGKSLKVRMNFRSFNFERKLHGEI